VKRYPALTLLSKIQWSPIWAFRDCFWWTIVTVGCFGGRWWSHNFAFCIQCEA